MVGITRNREIADALIAGMAGADLAFRMGHIPEAPISYYDTLNQLLYSPDVILCQNLEEIIIFANLAALDFFGRSTLGRPSIELVPNEAELRRKRAEAFSKIIKTGVPESFEGSPRIRADGKIVPVSGYAFRYAIDREHYSIGAKLKP